MNKILNDPDLDTVVEIACMECYCTNLTGNEALKNAGTALIGRAYALLREAGPDPSHLPYAHADLMDIDERNVLKERLATTLADLRNLDLTNQVLSITDADFMEVLINGIRNEVISYQAFIFKTIAYSRTCLEKKIQNLKKNMNLNFEQISRLELDLRNMSETEINSELEKNPNFDTLHTERITPFFLKMAKGSMQERSQTEIRDGNGREFANESDQRNYIVDHFANSFRKNPNEPENLEGCIENFLGPVVLNHPLIHSLKIDDREKINLESGLSIEELDTALEGANKNSAAGMDGLSTRFISRFWTHFRIPLHKYAGAVFQNGVLTNSFRCSIIKLIPKKGNASDIKNGDRSHFLDAYTR
jgi:hypothetical protein